ncbi:hypothetical protein N431DRAFT_429468 [Stipitochalara longipes BDJ]|nr:hypothetical protein N431DRAFT_429468 [Stipitochalara longipes BDJ]
MYLQTSGYEQFKMGFLSGLFWNTSAISSWVPFSQKHVWGYGVADLELLESEGMDAALVGG